MDVTIFLWCERNIRKMLKSDRFIPDFVSFLSFSDFSGKYKK